MKMKAVMIGAVFLIVSIIYTSAIFLSNWTDSGYILKCAL